MKLPRSSTLLIIWFIWAAGQNLDTIIRHSIKSDYYVFSNSGMEGLFFVYAFFIFILNVSTVYYLFRPYFYGFYTAFTSIALAAIQNIMVVSLAINDLPGIREAYEKSREIRGLPIRKEAMDMIFTVNGMQTTLISIFIAYFIVSFIVFRNKAYFYGKHA